MSCRQPLPGSFCLEGLPRGYEHRLSFGQESQCARIVALRATYQLSGKSCALRRATERRMGLFWGPPGGLGQKYAVFQRGCKYYLNGAICLAAILRGVETGLPRGLAKFCIQQGCGASLVHAARWIRSISVHRCPVMVTSSRCHATCVHKPFAHLLVLPGGAAWRSGTLVAAGYRGAPSRRVLARSARPSSRRHVLSHRRVCIPHSTICTQL